MAANAHSKIKITIGRYLEFLGGTPPSLRKALGKLSAENQALITRQLQIPIGCIDFVKEDYIAQDNRINALCGLPSLLNPKTTPASFQIRAANELITKCNGYLIGPTGSGKTLIVFLLMSLLKCRMLYITHRIELARQVTHMYFNEFREIAGFVGEGNRIEGKRLTVAVAQSIVHKPLHDSYGILYLDEIHHAPSATYLQVIQQYSSRYKYGGTGTLSRSDERSKLFPFILGKHQVEIPLEETIELVNLPDVIFRFVKYSDSSQTFSSKFFENFEENQISELTQKIRSDKILRYRMFVQLCGWVDREDRNHVVVEDVSRFLKAGLQSIAILTNRKTHAKHITKMLQDKGLAVFPCIGKIQEGSLDLFRTFGGVLVGTESLLGEGVNLPELQVLCLASPAGGRGKVSQRLGRLMRGEGRKFLVDYVDEGDEYSRTLYFARRNTYKRMKLTFRTLEEVLGELA